MKSEKNVILIKNNKGGLGKTFITVNLAQCLTSLKEKDSDKENKILILTDDSQNNILMYAEVNEEESMYRDLNWLLETNKFEAKEIFKNTFFIPFPKAGLSQVAIANFEKWLNSVRGMYDFILIDSNSSLESLEFMKYTDYWIAPTELTKVSINSLVDTMQYVGLDKLLALVPNKKRFTKNHIETENYIVNNLRNDLQKDFYISDSIRLSETYERLHIDKTKILTANSGDKQKLKEARNIFLKLALYVAATIYGERNYLNYQFIEIKEIKN